MSEPAQEDQGQIRPSSGISPSNGLRPSGGLMASGEAERLAREADSYRETDKFERRRGASLSGLAQAFKEQFGFEIIITPDDAGKVIYGDGKITFELRAPTGGVASLGMDAAPPEHPLQLYTETVSGATKVRVRYGTVWGLVPPEVQGGASPADITPSNGLKVWARVTVDTDGLPTAAEIGNGASVPSITSTLGYYLIGEMTVSGGAVTLNQAVTHSLNGQCCGTSVYNWWGV